MDNCLLVGNGLNRCLKHSISWGSLLKDLSEELEVDYNEEIAMPMEYERIVNSYLQKNPKGITSVHTDSKKNIAKKLNAVQLPEIAIHKQLMKIKTNAIITTNYDYLLEYIYNPAYKNEGDNKKYLAEYTSVQNGVQFYHPHGIASNYRSLCLGYEHYMGIVENIRREINTKENNETDKMYIKQILHGEKQCTNTWYERFYTSNIAIIGLGLTQCEADLWWLLTHRAYLYYSNYCNFKNKLKNKIIFYDTINDVKGDNKAGDDKRIRVCEEQRNRHILLENEHVIVKKYKLSDFKEENTDMYKNAYEAMISDIAKEGIA